MNKVIIGIHGLANKPAESILTDYWKQSITEGLKNVNAQNMEFNFEMVYWAKYLYRYTMHEDEDYKFDKLYNDEPYIAATKLRKYDGGWKDELRNLGGKTVGTGLDWFKRKFGVDSLADTVLGAKLKDLDYYYQECPVKANDGTQKSAKEVLREELIAVLDANKQHEIMLISHSMGTIIAYDVLRVLGNTGHKARIKHFVTIGSPLGISHVKQKIIEEREEENRPEAAKLRTPSIVTKSWVNYADKLDPVALDSHLGDDYGENQNKVQVSDDLVSNDYVGLNGESNHHKSYGYLRTPELSEQIKAFLEE
jgi:hypothetical protein